ncbi:CBS domain-containing protein [Algibacter amylolyticus]|uniref:CBS domain-containing protein n=1 Tax=Algibacter amylolyticus TaxID=1608400 RepID=A0A5M7BE07_9FLAO|nr:CBS domain-containing protein [Algibacter amylolyticus]KAA5827846.1 CBS domain-containing protein [Algibacter amylolyticus]MBB5267076.1 putative transcriptional regulator [Algibacter amylolyticus]TSJ82091.1 CBS domain-containing protein [Algibacter amylolyticus]
MKLSELIINDITPLSNQSETSDLKQLFNQLTYSHIPVKNENGAYMGCFSDTDAHCFDSEKAIETYLYALEDFYVRSNTLWLDVLEAFAVNSANIMPVLNEQNEYLGYYELNDVISLFSESPFFSEAGGILVVEKGINDYSFSEISQIVESNDGKLLGAFVSKMNTDLVQVTLKIGNTGLNEIIQTFRRYSYNIVSGHEEDGYIETLKERSDYLNKYLNM